MSKDRKHEGTKEIKGKEGAEKRVWSSSMKSRPKATDNQIGGGRNTHKREELHRCPTVLGGENTGEAYGVRVRRTAKRKETEVRSKETRVNKGGQERRKSIG